MDKKITIDDVAKYCGVSKTTVSRYLNHKYDEFSVKTRERIRLAVEELNYKPNLTAQRLKASKTHLIGCVLADVSNPFSSILLKGVMKVCEATGYQVLFTESGEDKGREQRAIERFIQNSVDGIIVNTCGDNDDLLLSIRESGLPIVLADRGLLGERKIDTVSHCNEESAEECTKFLREFGYNRVAFFTQGNERVSSRIERYDGYRKGMARYFPGIEPEIYVFDIADERSCLMQIQAYKEAYPDDRLAIISANGVTSRHLLLAFNKTEFVLGEDFGLCTYDDWDWLKLSSPSITSVWLPSQQMGEVATELLIKYIEGKRSLEDVPMDIKLRGKLNVRGSTIKIAP